MARKSKWVEVESPQEPVVDVARRAIGERLNLVRRYLKRSSQGAPSDTENVHQLRVSTRRAVAALEIFDAHLPSRRKRWMAKQLKVVRKAAGDARDLDVMLDRFRELAEAESDGQYGELVHFLKVQRQRAQEPIDERHEKLAGKKLRRRINSLVKRIRLRTKTDRFERSNYSDAAHCAFEPMVKSFFAACDGDFREYALLHSFRIEGKHLRYALEIFAAAYEPAVRNELYPLIVDLQERLGKINDHVVAHARFSHWLSEAEADGVLRSLFDALVAEEQKALESTHKEFLEWWTVDRRDDLRKQFADALGMDLEELRSSDQSKNEPESSTLALRKAE
jgi:CHAD domain-containing protein